MRKIQFLFFLMVLAILFCGAETHAQKNKKSDDKSGYLDLSESSRLAATENFEDGVKFSILEDWNKAKEKYEVSLSYFPQSAATLYRLAEAEMKLGKLDEALRHNEQVLELSTDNPYYYLQLATIYAASNKFDKAAETYLSLAEKVPGNNEYLESAADMQVRANNFKDALKTLNKIEKVYGVTENSTRNKINLYLRTNKLKDAFSAAQDLIDAHPEIPQYRLILAELYLANGKYKEAEADIKKLVETYKLSIASLMLYDLYSLQGKKKEADATLDSPFADSDVEIDQKVRVLSPYLNGFSSPEESKRVLELVALIVKAHSNDAKAWALQGDFMNLASMSRDARSSYIHSAGIKSNYQEVWEQIVLIDSQLDEADSLLIHTNQAVELFPNNGKMWFYNGRAQIIAKDYKKAASSLEQVKRLVSDNPTLLLETYALLGDAYNKLKEYKKSDQSFEAALSKDPDNTYLLNNYAYYLSERNENMSRAKELGDKLIKKEPDNANYLDTYGWILFRMREYDNAKVYLEKASEKGGSGVVAEHLGDVLFKLGEKDKALEKWKKAKELGGDVSPKLEKKIATKTLVNE